MNAKTLAALCVGLGSAIAFAYTYAGAITAATPAQNVPNSALSEQTAHEKATRPALREFCFSESLAAMSCEDQLIQSAATGHADSTQYSNR